MNQSDFTNYFGKFSFRDHPIITDDPSGNLGIIVVIPCYAETNIAASILSLNNATEPEIGVEVIVVVNQSESVSTETDELNQKTISELKGLKSKLWFKLHIIEELALPQKHAGVGLARKIGMDEALFRFSGAVRNGIIACFDADSTVAPNYFVALADALKKPVYGCNIFFEHNVEANSPAVNKAITDYELFLRYYNLALNYADLPYAHFTVGSSMAVSCEGYIKVGGMNKRKAGEDFYFLQKIIQAGKFLELTSTTVMPSARVSDRVPFGTGKAIADRLKFDVSADYETYSFPVFSLLKTFSDKLRRYDLNDWPPEIEAFLPDNFRESLTKVRKNNLREEKYQQGVFQLFSAFQVMKFLHFMRDEYGYKSGLNESVRELFKALGIKVINNQMTNSELLNELRVIDRTRNFRTKYIY